MHDLRCKTTYVASYRTEGCTVQILLAYLLGGPHGIQSKITIFLTKNLSLDAIVVVEFCVILRKLFVWTCILHCTNEFINNCPIICSGCHLNWVIPSCDNNLSWQWRVAIAANRLLIQ